MSPVEPTPNPTLDATVYTTGDQLRSYLNVDSTALPDLRANEIIETAEDLLDEALGFWPVDNTTGRKIVQANVDAWRWAKLNRAAIKLAARIYTDPDAATKPRFRQLSGPDFSMTDPIGSVLGDDVEAALNQSGLRRLTANVGSLGPMGGRAPWYSFAYNDTSWDYDPPPASPRDLNRG